MVVDIHFSLGPMGGRVHPVDVQLRELELKVKLEQQQLELEQQKLEIEHRERRDGRAARLAQGKESEHAIRLRERSGSTPNPVRPSRL